MSGDGSRRHGGRYNPPGIRAVYASLDLVTAIAELVAHNRRLGVADTQADLYPFIGTTLNISVERMLDLTDATVLQELNISTADLVGVGWEDAEENGVEVLTQAIGRLARKASFQAVLFPSAANRPSGVNVVLFPDRIRGGIGVDHQDKLPKQT